MAELVKEKFCVKDMPKDIRPRERLLELGPKALSPSELVAILLRTGSTEYSAIELGQKLLSAIGGITGLARMTPLELRTLKGIGDAKAAQLAAAVELGRRIANAPPGDNKMIITSPERVAALFMPEMRFLDREHFKALLLNTKNEVIKSVDISIGSLNASLVHPRELFKEAIKLSGASVIVLHNHPSGNITPSSEDIRLTQRIFEAGQLLGIELLDHIIIGDGKYLSMKEEGLIKPA